MPTTHIEIIDEQTRYLDNPRAAFFTRVSHEIDCPVCGSRLDTDGDGVWCTDGECEWPDGMEDE